MPVLRTLLIATISVPLLAGCATAPGAADTADVAWNGCKAAPTPECLIKQATSVASAMPSGAARSQAFIEIAMAEHALGDPDAAPDWTTHIVDGGEVHKPGDPGVVRDFLANALTAATVIDAPKEEAAALLLLAEAQADTGWVDQAWSTIDLAMIMVDRMTSPQDRADLIGRAAKVYAKTGNFSEALKYIEALPEDGPTVASLKARTLHDVGPLQSKSEGAQAGLATVRSATMGLQYYRASALTDIAKISFEQGRPEQAVALLDEASAIAESLDDGYFVAGVLRHVGEAAAAGGMRDRALSAYRAAVAGAQSQTPGEAKARSLSRVATAMAESGFVEEALRVLSQAAAVANAETDSQMRHYARYEIAGSMAFAGAIQDAAELAENLPDAPFSSAQSLRGVTLRDIAWGEAKAGHAASAVARAEQISTAREQVMALARIARVLSQPDMMSLSRYL